MYYVYILILTNNRYYVGYTSDLKVRIKEHFRGRVTTTKHRKPKLVYYSAFSKKKLALDFEKYLKSSSGFAFRNKHLV